MQEYYKNNIYDYYTVEHNLERNKLSMLRLTHYENLSAGIHWMKSSRQSGNTEDVILYALHHAIFGEGSIVVFGITHSHVSDLNHLCKEFIYKLNLSNDFEYKNLYIHNKVTGNYIYFKCSLVDCMRGYQVFPVYIFDCFSLTRERIQEEMQQFFVSVISHRLDRIKIIFACTGVPYKESYMETNYRFNTDVTFNHLLMNPSMKRQLELINNLGIGIYKNEYLCIR